jgi:urease accessory protein
MKPVRIGIGGPVGAGKTQLVERITRALQDEFSMAAITNDIYTIEDAKILAANGVLPLDRIIGIETGGCPHTAIREDTSMNEAAIAELKRRHGDLDIVFVESGGDNLSATFSPELVDFSMYIIDVAQGEKIPRKAGQGMIKSDFFVINKTWTSWRRTRASSAATVPSASRTSRPTRAWTRSSSGSAATS